MNENIHHYIFALTVLMNTKSIIIILKVSSNKASLTQKGRGDHDDQVLRVFPGRDLTADHPSNRQQTAAMDSLRSAECGREEEIPRRDEPPVST